MENKETWYVSIDIERLGDDIAAGHPIIQLGAAARQGKEPVDLFSVNFKHDERDGDPETVAWWKSDPLCAKTLDFIQKNDAVLPLEAMQKFKDWLENKKNFILVCYPTIMDGTWLYHYWFKYLGHPHGSSGTKTPFTAIDIRSYAAGKFNLDYADATPRKALKDFWPVSVVSMHDVCTDARVQLQCFWNIKNATTCAWKDQQLKDALTFCGMVKNPLL